VGARRHLARCGPTWPGRGRSRHCRHAWRDGLRGGQRSAGRRAASAELALIDGEVGVVIAPRGRLLLALILTYGDGRISEYNVIASPTQLDQLSITLLDYQFTS